MRLLPNKYEKRWVWYFLIYSIILLPLLSIPQIILSGSIALRSIIGLAGLAVLISLVTCGGGFLGGKYFFTLFTAVTVTGAGYMLFITVTQRLTGWADLTGFAGFLSITIIGFIIGLVGQLVSILLQKSKLKRQGHIT
jgi:hypothetical protein